MIIPLLCVVLSSTLTIGEQGWSEEVLIMQGNAPVVRYKARVAGGYLFVQTIHQKGWHTYAMDNELRATKALQGKKSLGIEQGMSIRVEKGLELEGPWLQTKPMDFSKPELRWYTYGFEQTAIFARRVKQVTANNVMLQIRGQACSGDTCSQIDLTLEIEAGEALNDEPQTTPAKQVKEMLKGLVPVIVPENQALAEGATPVESSK